MLGRLVGLYVLLVQPFMDIGLALNPMFDAAVTRLAWLLGLTLAAGSYPGCWCRVPAHHDPRRLSRT